MTGWKKLKDIRDRRSQPSGSPLRMEEVDKRIPEESSEEHGYHGDCYQKFTTNLHRLTQSESDEADPSTSCVPRRSSIDKDTIIFQPDCMFCKKEGSKGVNAKGLWKTKRTSKFEFDGWKKVIAAAEKKRGDEQWLVQIRGFDLFACEARYRKSCHKNYIANIEPVRWRSTNEGEKMKQVNLEEAHNRAFRSARNVIDDEILHKCKIMKLRDRCKHDVSVLHRTPFPNPK